VDLVRESVFGLDELKRYLRVDFGGWMNYFIPSKVWGYEYTVSVYETTLQFCFPFQNHVHIRFLVWLPLMEADVNVVCCGVMRGGW